MAFDLDYSGLYQELENLKLQNYQLRRANSRLKDENRELNRKYQTLTKEIRKLKDKQHFRNGQKRSAYGRK